MKKENKSIIWWLKWENYKSLWGLVIGLAVAVALFSWLRNVWISLGSFIVISFVSMIVIQIRCVDKYAEEYMKRHERQRYIEPENLRGQSEKIDKLLDLDKEINDFFNKYASNKKFDYFEKELNKQWDLKKDYFIGKADKILSSMNNHEILLGLLGTEMINKIINVFDYFKIYKIDVEYLKQHPEKAREYYYENLMQVAAIRENSINEYFYEELMNLNYFDEIEKFVLSCMSNKDLMDLADSSREWQEKLYYYGFIKPEATNDEEDKSTKQG